MHERRTSRRVVLTMEAALCLGVYSTMFDRPLEHKRSHFAGDDCAQTCIQENTAYSDRQESHDI